MNRDDYWREASLITVLRDHDKATKTAEERALAKLRRAGFNFKHLSEARAFKRTADKARRARAEQIALEAVHTRRTT